ncbi:MAG: hypothetical protein AB7S70_06705, partial [Hyphomicrobium sp.]
SSLFSFLIEDKVGCESRAAQEGFLCNAMLRMWAEAFQHHLQHFAAGRFLAAKQRFSEHRTLHHCIFRQLIF